MISRRDFLRYTTTSLIATSCAPMLRAVNFMNAKSKPMRCINIVNFIREIEPRFTMDMMLPVTSQMELILKHHLPATWLLQFDALVSGPFVPYLKEHMAKDHEVGFWFEMNEKHCKAAEVEWRGRPGYEWDHIPHVAFTIGYTEEERIKLADTAMREFKRIWGKYPKSVASWNLDSFTMAHLVEKYQIEAFAVCRDQIATDGFTIWGAPIAGYYPSKKNCWSPALDKKNQIDAAMFRMLGQDPVYYYEREWNLPNGQRVSGPDTMEPAWISGRTPRFIETFLDMIADAPTQEFAYAQLGQENTFPWDQQQEGYPLQMAALEELRKTGKVHIETMGESGHRFRQAFKVTPTQAQVQLYDPFGNDNPASKSIWYQSRFYRANLHIRGDQAYLRDLTTYRDSFEQPFLKKATRLTDVEQRMPAFLDGYHWRGRDGHAGGFLDINGQRIQLAGEPKVSEKDHELLVELPLKSGGTMKVRFLEKTIEVTTTGTLELAFEWDAARSALKKVEGNQAHFQWESFDYVLSVTKGEALATSKGWKAVGAGGKVTLNLAQPA